MSSRQLVLIAVALGALLLLWGAAALAGGYRSGATAERFALPAVDPGAVDTVRIARPQDTTTLVRRDSATWTVNGHPAASRRVNELLEALADTSRRSELVAGRSASHARLGVDTSGSRVTVSGRDGVLADLVLGQRSAELDGGYMRMAADSAVWLVRGELAATLQHEPDEWRDRRIGGVDPDSVARIEVTRGARSYSLRRSGDKWVLGGRTVADSAAVAELLGAFRQVEAGGFASPAQADSARFAKPDRRVRLAREDGTPLLTLAFDSMPAGFWVRADTGNVVYRMENWAADRLTPADSELRRTSQ